MKTVKDMSEITGISIRTLRYYDEIGLLKPTQLTEAGYRLYDNKALEKLQQIMFFRELEIPLMDIKDIMDNPKYDKQQALLTQKSLLEHKRNRLNGIIELISDVAKGVNTMSFERFNENDAKDIIANMQKEMSEEQFKDFIEKYGNGSIKNYEDILSNALKNDKVSADMLRWYGSKEKVIESSKPIKDMEELRLEHDEIYKKLARMKDSGDSEEENGLVIRLADSYKKMLNLDNARTFLIDLAKEYLANDKLSKSQDSQYGEGSTKYIAQTIQRYYGV